MPDTTLARYVVENGGEVAARDSAPIVLALMAACLVAAIVGGLVARRLLRCVT